MRRPFLIALIAGSLLVACSEQPTEVPSRPEPPALTPGLDVGPTACSLNSLLDLTKALFPPSPTLNLIIAGLKALPTNQQQRLATAIQKAAAGLIDVVTKAYNAGKLAGGKSLTTQNNLRAFINGLYCFVGHSEVQIPPGALDPNEGAIAVVTPNSPNTLVRPNSKHGAIFLPAASVPVAVTVTVSKLANNSYPLFTSLDQYPLFYEFKTFPDVTFTKDVTTGVCLADNSGPISSLRLAHNIGPAFVGPGNTPAVEILPFATAQVVCSDLPVLGSIQQGRGFLGGTLGSLARAVFLPTELHAAATAMTTAGIGGTLKHLSPFGSVDPGSNPASLSVKAGVPTHVDVAPGSVVSPSPAVVVKSNNTTPIANVPVVFAASAGGTVNGGASQTVNTDASGVATATNWNPGSTPGDHTLTATPPAIPQIGSVAPYKPAAAFNPTSLTFTATVAGSLDYLGTGYRYLILSESAPPEGFETQGFDDSGWSTGTAGFGFFNPVDVGCTLLSTGTNTLWPANTQILLRRPFTIPGGGSSATVSVAIDNDIKVFINGADITSTAKSDGVPVDPGLGGFIEHEGCASQDSFTFDATGLLSGVNLLVIQAQDRGSSSYVDAKVEAVSF
jgi:hypothetical protein